MVSIEGKDFSNKTILLRCDYNVPVNNNEIVDDTKIVKSLSTINYLLNYNCKLVILSHFGRVKSIDDFKDNSLKIISERLSLLLQRNVIFYDNNVDSNLKDYINNLDYGSIIMLENTRFTDVPEKRESACDDELSKYWASLGDVFVLDAFASSHRKHSSTYGITNYLPSFAGLLVSKEVDMLDNVVHNDKHPFMIVMGGAKVDDKLSLLKSLIDKCDKMFIGGGMANSFYKALGKNIGDSLACDDHNILDELVNVMNAYSSKIVLPIDFRCLDKNESVVIRDLDNIQEGDKILDIGDETIKLFEGLYKDSKIVFMNGTMGLHEDDRFNIGTISVLKLLANIGSNVYIGGGDTVSAVKKFNLERDLANLSTGGGATLDYIANGKLVALENIGAKNYE